MQPEGRLGVVYWTGQSGRLVKTSTLMSSKSPRAVVGRKRARQIGKRTTTAVLPSNRQRFVSFVEFLPGFAWMKDRKGRYLYVNRSVRQIPAYSRDWLGKSDHEIWPAEIADEYGANDQAVIATGREIQTIEHYLVGGETRYLLVTKFPILGPTGDVAIVGGISVNVTEQVHATEQLRKLTSRKRQILQLIAQGKNNKEIASLLQISVKTVETHRSRLMSQLDIHDVAGLVRYAIRINLISVG